MKEGGRDLHAKVSGSLSFPSGKGSKPRPTDRAAWEKAPWPPVVSHRQASRRSDRPRS